MDNKYFPHINRRFTASLGLMILIFVIGANFWQKNIFSDSAEKNLNMGLLLNPQNSALHEKLGQYYLAIDEEAAKREYLLAQEYYQSPPERNQTDVLGTASSPWQTWLNIIDQKQNRQADIAYWEKVKGEYPDYQYAQLKLALLYLQKGETEKSKDYVSAILKNDPTNPYALKLWQKVK